MAESGKMVTIYGASDDLIEVEGAINEEWGAYTADVEAKAIAFSDGTVLSVRYAEDGFWRISRIAVGTATYKHCPGTDGDTDYSDRVTLTGDIRWALYGDEQHLARARSGSHA